MFKEKGRKKRAKESQCCCAEGHPGCYRLSAEEELVVVSYPGPPRSGTNQSNVPWHGHAAPELLPIVTVINAEGSVDVVVESWPEEHWFDQPGAPDMPPQPQPAVCEQNALANAKVYPEEGQPGLDRKPPGLLSAAVEARPIYFVRLEAGQSTTVYAAPPGAWIRLRTQGSPASGRYCFSWCCPETVQQVAPAPSPPGYQKKYRPEEPERPHARE